ncbi:MAG TPA: hypothetical protein VEA40_17780 [Ramlibacter sp.]|nr:hypothetical protein [Ramlibacter sp.]
MGQDAAFEQLIARGLAASGRQQAQEAIRLFRQASELEPASGVPHFLIGSEHAAAGEVDSAEQAFAQALLLAPSFTIARYQLGLLQFTAGRPGDAQATWQPLLGLDDSHPLGHFARGFAALGRNDLGAAVSHYRAGLARNEENAALSRDIQLVVDAVEALQPLQETATAEAEAGHVLLSAYARGLH